MTSPDHPGAALVDVLERILFRADVGFCVFAQRLNQDAFINRDVHHLDPVKASGRDLLKQRLRDRVIPASQNSLRLDIDQIILHYQVFKLFGVVLLPHVQHLLGVEQLEDILVGPISGARKKSWRKTAAAATVHVDPHDVARIKLDFDPRATVGVSRTE